MGFFSTGSNKNSKNKRLSTRLAESGNVFLMLFGAVGMVGVLGAATNTILKGPVKTMAQVTKRTVAENNMIAAGKLALIAAGQQTANGDCDADTTVEPVPFDTGVTTLTGGGGLPTAIGVAKQDPWGQEYGYCAWDHGTAISTCGAGLLDGSTAVDEYVLTIVSAGPDGIFQTSCANNTGAGTQIVRGTGDDDLVLGYTLAEASTIAAGIWSTDGTTGASIARDIVIKDKSTGLNDAFAFDSDTAALTLGAGGSGNFPTVGADNLQSFSGAAGTVNVLSTLSSIKNVTTTGNISTSGSGGISSATTISATGNVTGADLVASGALTGATLGVSGASTIGGALNVTGASTLGTLNAGATGVSTFSTSGLATLNSASVTGTSTLTGNVGIGGAPTANKLQVTGNVNIDGTTTMDATNVTGQLTMTNATSANPDIQFTGSGVISSAADQYFMIDSDNSATTNAFKFLKDTNVTGTGAEIFKIDESGLVTVSGRITNLATPTAASDAATKSYVDGAITTGVPGAETDPQVGTLTNGKWCTTDGTDIDCTSDAPSSSDTLAALSCSSGQVAKYNGSAWACAADNGGSGGGSGSGFKTTIATQTTAMSIPGSAWTTVPFQGESRDDGDWHDNSTNNSRITVDETGLYIIDAIVDVFKAEDSSAYSNSGIRLVINGTPMHTFANIEMVASPWDKKLTANATIELNSGDYIELQVRPGGGKMTRPQNTYFSVSKLTNGGSSSGSSGSTVSSMIDGWPDAISCTNSAGRTVNLFLGVYRPSVNNIQYMNAQDSAAHRVLVIFNADKTYNTNYDLSGYDCVTGAMSISDLESAGKAFYFVGGSGGGSGTDVDFGAPESRSISTDYTAATAGIVTAAGQRGAPGACQISGIVDGIGIGHDGGTYNTGNGAFISFPVKKGATWRINQATSGYYCYGTNIHFTPLIGGGGSGGGGSGSGSGGTKGLYAKGATTVLPTSTNTTIAFPTTVSNDFGSAWDGSTFTVPAGEDGWYQISGTLHGPPNTSYLKTMIFVNGSGIRDSRDFMGPGGNLYVNVSAAYELSAGDTVEIKGQQGESAAAVGASSNVSIVKIGGGGGGSGDDLGDHTATTDLNMGTNVIKFTGVAGAAPTK